MKIITNNSSTITERTPDPSLVIELNNLSKTMPRLPFHNLNMGCLVGEDLCIETEILQLFKAIVVEHPEIPQYFNIFIDNIKKEFQNKVSIDNSIFHYLCFGEPQWICITTDPNIKDNLDQKYYFVLSSHGLSSMQTLTMEEAVKEVHYILTKYAKNKYTR